jgi:vancomycin resistance protein YoaR
LEEEIRPEEKPGILKSLRQHKVLFLRLGAVIVLLASFVLSLVIYTWDKGKIASGVVIEIPLGQLSIEEAKEKLELRKKELLDFPIHFTADGEDYYISTKALGLTYSYEGAFQQAYLIGRKGNILERTISKLKARRGINIDPVYQWNDQLLTLTLQNYFRTLNRPSENAYFTITPANTMDIAPEKFGKQVNMPALISNIKKEVANLRQTAAKTNIAAISIPIDNLTPAVTKASLEGLKISGRLSTYTTHFDPSLIGRTQNIKLAAKTIDGTLLKPDEVFSFNNIVGPRTAEAGYQIAIIIEGHQFVPGLGGGVCQVSSTLFNAVQAAHLNIVERNHHSLPITYVPPGQDATVAYPNLDFKFKNTSGGYLLIRSNTAYDTLTFSLYGKVK